MTTLHEEPLGQRPLSEEPEDTYSDPEYDADYEYEKNTQIIRSKSRLSGSKTMDSLMDIGNSTTNVNNINSYAAPNVNMASTALKHVTGLGTPSMSSSTSSGYGSQVSFCSLFYYKTIIKFLGNTYIFYISTFILTNICYILFCFFKAVSCSNLTNDDTLSLRSMSVDDTPGNLIYK